MDRYIDRLQKRIAGDGSTERQILLLKIIHEFENAPNFGAKYSADASSEPQRWIARIGALLARAGLEHKIAFGSVQQTMVSYWTLSRESFRQKLLAAAEEIKLELELDGRENIGQVYGPQRQHDFLCDLKEIILSAQESVLIVDPYFDGQAFETFAPLQGNCFMRILCSKYARNVAGHILAFEAQYERKPELRTSRDLHDRLIIVDGSDCWITGGSVKDGGKKPTYLIPLQPIISSKKIRIYEDLWQQAAPV